MLAVVFPGQGSQAVGMAADFVRAEPAARQVFEEADEAFGAPLSRLISEGPESELQQTEITQPALLTASIAIYRTLEPRLPAAPSFFAGHSLGEYSALVAAGGLPLGEAVKLVRHRGALMQAAVPSGEGEMAAVIGLSSDEVARICDEVQGVVAATNFNSPVQTVIGGARDPVRAAARKLKAAGARRVVTLVVSAPFHSPLMAPAMEKLVPALAAARFVDPRVPVISNVTALAYQSADEARVLLRDQVCAPVRWVDCVRQLVAAGTRAQLEVGPGKVLSGLAARIDSDLARASVETLDDVEAAMERVGEALA